jgi:cell division protein FtsN
VQLPTGTWYRGGVGPFGSREDANNFCQSLQGSGQACIVQRN